MGTTTFECQFPQNIVVPIPHVFSILAMDKEELHGDFPHLGGIKKEDPLDAKQMLNILIVAPDSQNVKVAVAAIPRKWTSEEINKHARLEPFGSRGLSVTFVDRTSSNIRIFTFMSLFVPNQVTTTTRAKSFA